MGSNRLVWPLVTGTFGGVDFLHSLLGEASDHLSETQISDLNEMVDDAQYQDTQALFDKLKFLLRLIPSVQADLDVLQQNEQTLANQGQTFHLAGTMGEGAAISPEDIANKIYPILAIRDKVMKIVQNAIDSVCISLARTNIDSWD